MKTRIFFQEKKKIPKIQKQQLPPVPRNTFMWGSDVFSFSDVRLSIQILNIFDTAEIRLLKFHQPSHSSSVRLIFINPICYLKSSLTKRPLLNQESRFEGNHKNVQ